MTSLMVWCLVMAILAVILSVVGGTFAFLSYAKVVGMEKSTHQVAWMPMEESSSPTGKELAEKMAKAFNEFPESDHV